MREIKFRAWTQDGRMLEMLPPLPKGMNMLFGKEVSKRIFGKAKGKG